MGAIIKALTSLTSVSAGELAKAKVMLKSKMYRQTEEGPAEMVDLGHQLLVSGSYGSPADFAGIIDSVTEAQVVAVAKKLLLSKPTIAAYGDTHTVPHYSAVESALKA